MAKESTEPKTDVLMGEEKPQENAAYVPDASLVEFARSFERESPDARIVAIVATDKLAAGVLELKFSVPAFEVGEANGVRLASDEFILHV